jgi:hypothetical protein
MNRFLDEMFGHDWKLIYSIFEKTRATVHHTMPNGKPWPYNRGNMVVWKMKDSLGNKQLAFVLAFCMVFQSAMLVVFQQGILEAFASAFMSDTDKSLLDLPKNLLIPSTFTGEIKGGMELLVKTTLDNGFPVDPKFYEVFVRHRFFHSTDSVGEAAEAARVAVAKFPAYDALFLAQDETIELTGGRTKDIKVYRPFLDMSKSTFLYFWDLFPKEKEASADDEIDE